MKKCQMHNKKKRQALLSCNAALFGCNWRLCLSFFGPPPWFQAMGSSVSYTDFLCHRHAYPSHPCAYTICSPAQHAGSSKLGTQSFMATGTCSAAPCLHWWHSPLYATQQGHPAFTGGWGGSHPPLHVQDAAGPATAEQILRTHPGKAWTSLLRSGLCWGHRAQNPSVAPPPTNSSAVLGQKNLWPAFIPFLLHLL